MTGNVTRGGRQRGRPGHSPDSWRIRRLVVDEAAVRKVGHGELKIGVDRLRVRRLDGVCAAVEDLFNVQPADGVAGDGIELVAQDLRTDDRV